MKCTKCKREGAVIRLRTKDVFCRLCGHVEVFKDQVTENKGKNEK